MVDDELSTPKFPAKADADADWGVINEIYSVARTFFRNRDYTATSAKLLHLLSLATRSTRSMLVIHADGEELLILDGFKSWKRPVNEMIDTLPLLYQSYECTRVSSEEIEALQSSLGLDLEKYDSDGAYFAFEMEGDSIFFLFFRDQHHGRYSDDEYRVIDSISTSLEDQVRFSLMASQGDQINQQLDNHRKRQSIWLEALAWLNEVNVNALNVSELNKFYETALFQLKLLVLAESAVAFKLDEELVEFAEHDAAALSEELIKIFQSEDKFKSFTNRSHEKLCADQYMVLQAIGIKEVLIYPVYERSKLSMLLCVAKSEVFDAHEEMVASLFSEGIENIIERMHFLRSISQQNELLKKEKEEQQKLISQLNEATDQLMQQEKMASIGQLAAGVAHEINNPVGYVNSNINSMEGYIQDLYKVFDVYAKIEKRLPKEHSLVKELLNIKEDIDFDFIRNDVKELISESKEGVTRVKQIVKDMKDFSHVGQSDWQLTNLVKGIDSTLNIVHNEIKYKATVEKEYNDIPQIECVPSQINQVIMNLLVNASHAIEERGVITIRVSQVDDEHVCIEIQDTGKGIKKEQLSSIFNPFFTTKPVGQGTGLGLSLSYSIIENHNGELSVESEVGVGTTFRVVLPVHQEARNSEGKE